MEPVRRTTALELYKREKRKERFRKDINKVKYVCMYHCIPRPVGVTNLKIGQWCCPLRLLTFNLSIILSFNVIPELETSYSTARVNIKRLVKGFV